MYHQFKQPIGIAAYAGYIPQFKINSDEIHGLHHPQLVQPTPSKYWKAVPAVDEDTATFSLQIADYLTQSFPQIDYSQLQSIYVGSESPPYAVKPTGTILADYFQTPHLTTANLEHACKAGTAGLQIVASQVSSQMITYGLAIGVDIAQAHPGDALETTAGAGGAGFLVSRDQKEIIAQLISTSSFTTDTPDFWRRAYQSYPQHTGRFTGEPAYFKHVAATTQQLLENSKISPQQFTHVVFHSPNAKFPQAIAKQFGFKATALVSSQLFPEIGNAYAGSSMLGLAYALDHAQPNQYILVASYGSGAGSDGFIIKTTNLIKKNKSKFPIKQQLTNRISISHAQYLKHHHLI